MKGRDSRQVVAGVAALLALITLGMGVASLFRGEDERVSQRYGDIAPVTVKWGGAPAIPAVKADRVMTDFARQEWAAAVASGAMASDDSEDLADQVEAVIAVKAQGKRQFQRRKKGKKSKKKLTAAAIEALMQDPDDEADSGAEGDDEKEEEGDEIDAEVDGIGSQEDLLAAIQAERAAGEAEGEADEMVEIVPGDEEEGN